MLLCRLDLQVTHARQDLSEAISKWEGAVGPALQAPRGLLETAQDSSQPVHRLQQQIVQLQGDVKHHSAALKQAYRYCARRTLQTL